jgi:hypothetical protein
MSTATNQQEPTQLPLFDVGTTLTELSVDALQGDPEAIRGAALDLLTLVHYHDAKTVHRG